MPLETRLVNAVKEMDIAEGATLATADLQVERGLTVHVQCGCGGQVFRLYGDRIPWTKLSQCEGIRLMWWVFHRMSEEGWLSRARQLGS